MPDILISKSLYKELDVHNTNHYLLLKDTLKINQADFNKDPEGIEVLIPAGDPKNLGALIRTSLALGASNIVLLEESAHPFLPDVIKTSAGAVFKAELLKGPSIKDLEPQRTFLLLMVEAHL